MTGQPFVQSQDVFPKAHGVRVGYGKSCICADGADIRNVVIKAFQLLKKDTQPCCLLRHLNPALPGMGSACHRLRRPPEIRRLSGVDDSLPAKTGEAADAEGPDDVKV